MPASAASASAIAAMIRGCRSGDSPVKRTLRSFCGNGSNRQHVSLAGRCCSTTAASTCSAATSPSPVVEKSLRMMWPDCSPPRFSPSARIRSTT